MPSIGNLSIIVSANTAPLASGLGKATSQLKGFGTTVGHLGNNNNNVFVTLGQAAGTAGQNLARTGSSGSAALAGLAGAVGLTTTALIGAGVAAAGFGVKLAADAEQAQIAFGVMLNSAQKARTLLTEIRSFAAATPFKTAELTGAAQRLLAYGVSADKLMPTLRVLGDISAGTGKNLSELAVIFGQVRSQGRLLGQDSNQLAQAGIPILELLAKQYGKTTAEVLAMREAGRISFSDVASALQGATQAGGKFFEMTEKQSKSFAGRWSTLTDNLELGLMGLGGEALGGLEKTGLLTRLTLLVEEARPLLGSLFKDLGAGLEKLGLDWGDVGRLAIKSLGETIKWLGSAVEAAQLFGGVMAKAMVAPLADFAAWISDQLGQQEFGDRARRFRDQATALGDELLKVRVGAFGEAVDAAVGRVEQRFREGSASAKTLGGSIAEAVTPAERLAQAVGNIGNQAFSGLGVLEAFAFRARSLLDVAAGATDGRGLLQPTDFAKGAAHLDAVMADVERRRKQAERGFFGAIINAPGSIEGVGAAQDQLVKATLAQALAGKEVDKFAPGLTRIIEAASRFAAGRTSLIEAGQGMAAMAAELRGAGFGDVADRVNALSDAMRGLEATRFDKAVGGALANLSNSLNQALTADAWKAFAGARSPLETFRSQLVDLDSHLTAKRINLDTYTRSVATLWQTLEKGSGLGEVKLPGIAERGSSEAVSALNRWTVQAQQTPANRVEAHLDALRRIEERNGEVQRQILEQLRKTGLVQPAGVP